MAIYTPIGATPESARALSVGFRTAASGMTQKIEALIKEVDEFIRKVGNAEMRGESKTPPEQAALAQDIARSAVELSRSMVLEFESASMGESFNKSTYGRKLANLRKMLSKIGMSSEWGDLIATLKGLRTKQSFAGQKLREYAGILLDIVKYFSVEVDDAVRIANYTVVLMASPKSVWNRDSVAVLTEVLTRTNRLMSGAGLGAATGGKLIAYNSKILSGASGSHSALASYNTATQVVQIAVGGRDVDAITRSMAHELGHKVYFTLMGNAGWSAWQDFFEANQNPPDIDQMLADWVSWQVGSTEYFDQKYGLYYSTYRDHLKKLGDRQTLMWLDIVADKIDLKEDLSSKKNPSGYEQMLAKKGSIKAFLYPVSAYSATKPEELFAEVLGFWLSQGPQRVPEVVRDAFLRAVPSMRTASTRTAAVPEKYEHIDFKPPQSVAEAAEKGLEYRQKASPSNKGGLTPAEASKQGIGSGVQRAVNLKNRDNTSPEVVKQMAAFFSRHEKNKGVSPEHKGEPWNDKGNVAWLIWGGDPGRAWAEKVKGQMEAADEKAKKKASMGTPSHRIAEDSVSVEKALHPLAVIASEVESLESLWSDVQAILDTYAETVPMPVVGRIAAITLHSQRDCFTKCEHAMRHCERVQNMARTYLDENPGDETASAAMRDAAMLYTRFAAGRAKSREMLSALSQKIMPKDLQRITTEAVETVRAALNYPNALSVTVHPYFAPCKVGDRTVDAMVFNVYLTAYPQPMGGAPEYQQFLLSQATLGDTSVYLTVIDRTNENATTQPVKVDAGAGKKILGYLKGWGNLSPAPTTKMAARPRKPLTREQVSAMGAAEINKWRDVLDKESSGITDELIAAGRGNERPTETVRMTDPLALRYIQNWKDTGLLRDEIARRYGPGAPTRLPRGFGPIKKFPA